MTAPAQRPKPEWCDDCLAHDVHRGKPHPEFLIKGEVKVEADFHVDLYQLITKHPRDWKRIVETSRESIDECANLLVVEFTVEDGWEAPYQGEGLVRWQQSWDPEVDWQEPGGRAGREDFWERLEARLQAEGLWPTEDGEEIAVPPDPAALGMAPLPFPDSNG